MALTRVTQNATEAIVHSTAKRSAMARASAGRNAMAVQAEMAKFGWKTMLRTTTTGITTAMVSSLNVRLLAICRWMGWTGLTRSGESDPWRIQYSISHMIQVNVACETTSATR